MHFFNFLANRAQSLLSFNQEAQEALEENEAILQESLMDDDDFEGREGSNRRIDEV